LFRSSLFLIAGLGVSINATMAQQSTGSGASGGSSSGDAVATAASAASSTPASGTGALDTAPAKFSLVPKWTVQIEPSVWFVSPGGDMRLPAGASATSSPEFEIADLNIDSPRLSPFGKVHLRSGNWTLGLMGFGYSIDRSAVLGRDLRVGNAIGLAGEKLRTSFDFASFEATGGYRLLETDLVRDADGTANVIASLDGLFGARMYDLDIDVRVQPGPLRDPTPDSVRARESEFFIEPLVGLKGELELYEQVTANVQLSAGYGPWDNTSVSWDVIAGFAWRPTPNVGVQIGYRQLAFRLESGEGTNEFKYTGSLAGLYFGLFFRF
jgi:opacity protein-like surface antigen